MARPGWKRLKLMDGGREVVVNVRDDQPPEPTQAELEDEIRGAVSLGWQTRGTPRRAGQTASWHKYELLVDVNDPHKTWLRSEAGTLSRNFSTEPEPAGEPLGSIPLRRRPEIFGEAPAPEPQREEVDAWGQLDPATRAALSQIMGGR